MAARALSSAAPACTTGPADHKAPGYSRLTGALLTVGFAAAALSPAHAVGDDERVETVLAAQQRNKDRTAERRAAARGDAEPRPREERHLSKADQLQRDTSAASVLDAIEFVCGCSLPHCAKPTRTRIVHCRASRAGMKNAGSTLLNMLTSAVVEEDDGRLIIDYVHGQVSISHGVIACPRRFISLYGIKPNMSQVMRQAAVNPDLPTSMWRPGGARAERPAYLRDTVQAWIRAWAQLTGDYSPTGSRIQLDAATLDSAWRLYLVDHPEGACTYAYFCACWKEEALRLPTIVRPTCPQHHHLVSSL